MNGGVLRGRRKGREIIVPGVKGKPGNSRKRRQSSRKGLVDSRREKDIAERFGDDGRENMLQERSRTMSTFLAQNQNRHQDTERRIVTAHISGVLHDMGLEQCPYVILARSARCGSREESRQEKNRKAWYIRMYYSLYLQGRPHILYWATWPFSFQMSCGPVALLTLHKHNWKQNSGPTGC